MNLGPYMKAVVAVLGIIAAVGRAISGPATLAGWMPVVIAVATFAGVYIVPNARPPASSGTRTTSSSSPPPAP